MAASELIERLLEYPSEINMQATMNDDFPHVLRMSPLQQVVLWNVPVLEPVESGDVLYVWDNKASKSSIGGTKACGRAMNSVPMNGYVHIIVES